MCRSTLVSLQSHRRTPWDRAGSETAKLPLTSPEEAGLQLNGKRVPCAGHGSTTGCTFLVL